MKINEKYQSPLATHSEYVEFCRKLWEIAELQQKLMPNSLGFGIEIQSGMVNFEQDMLPTCGFMIGGELGDLNGFLDSMALELRTVLSEARRK